MARGLTKEVASTTGRPASASICINCIFCAVGMRAFSFCKPSRGPTSTIRTEDGRVESVRNILKPLLFHNVGVFQLEVLYSFADWIYLLRCLKVTAKDQIDLYSVVLN